MGGGGAEFMEIWEIFFISLLPLTLFPVMQSISYQKNWLQRNYEGKRIPYTLGVLLLSYTALFFYVFPVEHRLLLLVYITLLWFVGWMDDVKGTKYPKGIKGHLRYFIEYKKWTTALTKMLGISVASFFVIIVSADMDWGALISFGILILSPHVTNAFDTRPLRVWKWSVIQFIIFSFFLPSIQENIALYMFIFLIVWGYVETTKKAMLGDNGATCIGGIIAVLLVFSTPLSVQLVTLFLYVGITWIVEKISLHEWIEKISMLRAIDRLGRL